MWIEDSDVNVHPIKASAPEPVSSNVQPSTILDITSYLFSINGLKVWLNANVGADLRE